jgi:hypothetical protein
MPSAIDNRHNPHWRGVRLRASKAERAQVALLYGRLPPDLQHMYRRPVTSCLHDGWQSSMKSTEHLIDELKQAQLGLVRRTWRKLQKGVRG